MISPETKTNKPNRDENSSMGGTLSSTNELRDVTLKMFDGLFPLLLTVGTPTLALAVYRTYQFGRLSVIAAYVFIYAALVTVIGLRRRLPLWVVSLVICALGIGDGILTLFNYSFASAGFLLLSLSTICAGVFFGLRGGLIVYGLSLSVSAVIAVLMCTGNIPLAFDTSTFLIAPSAWGAQLIHFALLALLGMIMVHTIQVRLVGLIKAIRTQTSELTESNRVLKEEVSARIKAEADFVRSDAQYRLLASQMHDIMFQMDLDLNILYVSPSVEKLFGYSVDEASALKVPDFLTPDSLKRVMYVYPLYRAQAEKEDMDLPLQELELIRKDGTIFWGELSVKFLRDDDGKLVGLLGVLRDISERRRSQAEKEDLEDKLRQSEKLEVLGRLAGGVAHDFNNQLTGILGYAELLQSKRMGDNFPIQASEMIIQCAKRAKELTSKLLAFARKGSYKTEPIDLHDIIHEVSAILERSIDKNVTITKELKAKKSVVIGDASLLQNALLNLAVNAGDAMPNGGTIQFTSAVVDREVVERVCAIGTLTADQYIEIRVRDTGIGIDEATQKLIFEPFFTTKESGHGTGMGLAAVHGTVAAHNGFVAVQSTPGVGSVFSLFLPVSLESISKFTFEKSHSVYSIVRGRILLIEDEQAVRRVVQLHLVSQGFEVETAEDGAAGIDLFTSRNGDFDLVLLDLILPRIDGSKVFTSLRALNPNIKVLLLTGHSGHIAPFDLIQKGALDIITKPFSLSQLLVAVEKALAEE